ncbi:MAG: MtrB/PioB family decaheme-associated outer membrane protein [Steroidobacteraceae bacterium]|jgi:MtrB/PioB family decaheme-associated outer membrane protein
MKLNRSNWLVPGLIAALASSGALADDPPSADTGGWKCTQCPFAQGYSGDAELGVLGASGANATFGRYTGIDHGGAYADAAASGQYRNDDGSYANYELDRLGLASRDGYVEGGREGRYDLRVSYDGQPNILYDTGATPYRANGSTLGLPAGWVSAGGTAGMGLLGTSLAPVTIESERRTVALLGRYFASPSWTVFGEFRRQEHDGSGLTGASFLTEAVQLAQPFDYVTNSLETGVAWAGRKASVRVSYLGSWFDDDYSSLTFANPYLPIVPGSTLGQLATPPGNTLQQLSAAGNAQLPWRTTLTFTASIGTLKQNAAFLPVSALPGAQVPTPDSLDGDVHLSHYALGLASRPLSKLSVRGNATYDGHDDKTSPLTLPYVVTDTFPGGTALTPRYSEDRVRLDGGADYVLAHWIKIGVGGKLDDIHYGPGQVVTWTQNAESWGRGTITPIAPLSITLKIGNGLRKASSFDAAALPPDESPLIREYNYAPRDRVFYTLTGAWTVTPTLTWSVEGSIAKDDYRSSPLGLQSVHEQRGSTNLTWTPRDTLSAYIEGGYERLFNLQSGYSGPDTIPWLAGDAQRFWNLSAGGRWVPQERWTLSLDYLLAPSYDNTDTTAGGLQQAFPQNWTKLDSTRLDLAYRWTSAMQIHVRYVRETYSSNDWALDGVGPSSVPNLLALGVQPFGDNVNLFALTVRYQFGRDGTKPQASK